MKITILSTFSLFEATIQGNIGRFQKRVKEAEEKELARSNLADRVPRARLRGTPIPTKHKRGKEFLLTSVFLWAGGDSNSQPVKGLRPKRSAYTNSATRPSPALLCLAPLAYALLAPLPTVEKMTFLH